MSELVAHDQTQDQTQDERPAGPTVPTAPSWTERIAGLDHLTNHPLAEHADAYDALHTDLKRRLGEVDGH